MNDRDARAFEDLLDELVSGERSPDDPLVRSHLERGGEAAAAIREAVTMQTILNEAGEERARALDGLDAHRGAPGEDRVADLVQGYFSDGVEGTGSGPAGTRRLVLVVGALAAAALLLVIARPLLVPGGGPEPGGGGETRLVLGLSDAAIRVQVGGEPVAPADFRLVWAHPDAPLGTRYAVVLFQGEGPDRVEVERTSHLTGSPWIPSSTDLDALSRCDSLRVEAIDMEGSTVFEESSALIPRRDLSISW